MNTCRVRPAAGWEVEGVAGAGIDVDVGLEGEDDGRSRHEVEGRIGDRELEGDAVEVGGGVVVPHDVQSHVHSRRQREADRLGDMGAAGLLTEAEGTLDHRIDHLAPVEVEQLHVVHGGGLIQPMVILVEELQVERAHPHVGRPAEVDPHVLVAGPVRHHRHPRHPRLIVHDHRTERGHSAGAEGDDDDVPGGVNDGRDRRVGPIAPVTGSGGTCAEGCRRHQGDRGAGRDRSRTGHVRSGECRCRCWGRRRKVRLAPCRGDDSERSTTPDA